MPIEDKTNEASLDAQAIRELVANLSREETALFKDVIVDLRSLGSGISDVVVDKLAKKYADKARKLAGDGGSEG